MCGRLDHAEEHPDRRGLAGAVEAEEGVDLAASDPQVDPVDREHVAAVALCQRLGPDGLIAHGARLEQPAASQSV